MIKRLWFSFIRTHTQVIISDIVALPVIQAANWSTKFQAHLWVSGEPIKAIFMHLLTQDFNEKSYINKMFCLVHTSQIYAIIEGLLSQNRKKRKKKEKKHCLKQIICRHEEIKA